MLYLTLLAGLILSATAGYYSIIGLIAIFPGATLPIVLMGGSLEFAKLVAASWLYRNWDIAPKVIKGYFIFAIIVLMFITSLGTFGFLSKVHLETSATVADNTVEIAKLENSIQNEERKLNNAQNSILILDDIVAKNFDSTQANSIREKQKIERTQLNTQIEVSSEKISDLRSQLTPLKQENLKAEVEVGPLKYIAEMIYGQENAKNHFGSAVRFVIILIVLVFDPLAVLLLIAANISYNRSTKPQVEEKIQYPKQKKPNYVIEKNDIVQGKSKKVAKSKRNQYNKDTSVYNFMARDDFGISHTNKVNENESTRKVKEKHND